MLRLLSLARLSVLVLPWLAALPGNASAQTPEDPNALCACITEYQKTILQAEKLATCRWADASCVAVEVRVTKPWTYNPAKGVCGGSFEIWTTHAGRQPRNETVANDQEFSLDIARKRCTEIGVETGPRPTVPPGGAVSTSDLDQMAFALSSFAASWQQIEHLKRQQAGQDAFFVHRAGGQLSVINNRGVERPLPGFMAERLRSGPPYGVLDDRAAVDDALNAYGWTPAQAQRFWSILQREADYTAERLAFEYINWRNGAVSQYLSNTSLWTIIGPLSNLLVSSEHGSMRGTINGGGDFVRRIDPTGPRMVRAARVMARAQAQATEVVLELPFATVSSRSMARVLSDLSASRIAAISVVEGEAQVRERITGRALQVGAGQFVIILPGVGLTSPRPIPSARRSTMRVPSGPVGSTGDGTIVLQPGEAWAGTVQLRGTLGIEARLIHDRPAGSAYALEVQINGRALLDPVVNKMSPMRYADGRNYPYREPNSARWMLFSSPDYRANNGSAGGVYEVKTDPGEAYRYVWDVGSIIHGAESAQVQFRNVADSGGLTLELRLLPSEPLNRDTTGTPPAPATTQPPTAAGATPSPSTPAGAGVAAGGGSGQGPHLVIYTMPELVGQAAWVYPVVVQLQDGAGQPMYPAALTRVTVTSSDPSLVEVYDGDGDRAVTTLRLQPPEPGRVPGMSWDSVNMIARRNVAGTVTLRASAPGLPGASVTVAVVPAGREPAAGVRFMVLPPVVETDRMPVMVADLVGARGQLTSDDWLVDKGWTLQSSNPAVFETFKGRNRLTGSNFALGRAPGRVELTLIPDNRTFGSATTTVTFIAPPDRRPATPPPPSTTHAPSTTAPASGGTGVVTRRPDFGESAGPFGQQAAPRIFNVTMSRDFAWGKPVGPANTFPPDVNPIHLSFRFEGLPAGATLGSVWYFMDTTPPTRIGDSSLTVTPPNDWAHFSFELEAGKRWPVGNYRVDIVRDGVVLGSATFTATGTAGGVREPARGGRVSEIVTARGVRDGVPVGVASRFTPDVNPIYVRFRIEGFAPGTVLLSRWTYLGSQQPLVIGTAELHTEAGNDYAHFDYELAPGKQWPAGEYRIEILHGTDVVGSTAFEVR